LPERVTPERSTHPVLFLMLFVPMGISNGYVVVTLGYLLAKAGVGVDAIAMLGVWALLPQTWKVLGGPLVDTTLSNKTWYAISATVTGLLMAATAIIPPTGGNFFWITALAFLFSAASSFTALSADSIMAHATTPEQKGRAGGWSQAGNLGGSSIGGGVGLWLSQNLTPQGNQGAGHWLARHTHIDWFANAGVWFGDHVSAALVAGCFVGVLCILSCIALFYVHEPVSEHREKSFAKSVENVGKDLWSLLKSRKGLLAFVAMSLPISVGAMTQLWSAVANDWHASAFWVALVNGVLGGVLSMIGCIVGGWLCDKMNRMLAFNLFSLIVCVCSLGMAFAPHSQTSFIWFVSVYMFLTGLCYAAFGAVVLEAIGKGAAATKYNLLAGLANVPIMYLSWLDGKAAVWHAPSWIPWRGSTLMLVTEAFLPVLGSAVFLTVAYYTRRYFKHDATESFLTEMLRAPSRMQSLDANPEFAEGPKGEKQF
jgi:MFS transporter, PAT family, beta-lactamase induction signal transducer AmpG